MDMQEHAKDKEYAAQALNISKYYTVGEERVAALKNVTVNIKQGDFVAITGPSGSGKSTLLNCLSGLDRVTEGEVVIGGRTITGMTDREISRFRASNMGFVFQNYALLPVFNVAENVELPALITGVRASEARKMAMEVLDFVGLKNRFNFRPDQLSGGEQQRVAIARSLINRPSVLWADEPTGNLDSESGSAVLELFARLNSEHRSTVVVVTHNAEVASRTRTRIRLSDGKITDERS